VVLAEGWDPRIRAAAERIERAGLARTIVLERPVTGHPRLAEVADLVATTRPGKVRDERHALELAADPIRFAAGLVALGVADAAVAGATCPTAEVLRAALWLLGPAEGITTISGAFYMVMPGDGLVLTFSDSAVVPDPTEIQLAEIALAAARDRRRIVGDEPVVAFLSYSTRGSADGPSVDRVRRAVERFHRAAPEIAADGELQADAALVAEVGIRKAPGSTVVGRANVLVVPDLDSGNIAYKLVQRLAGAVAIGPILQGLARPMADLSRGATADDVIDVAAATILQAADPG
jgi:phosphate acetyltransferase